MAIGELGAIHDSPRSTASRREENELLEALAMIRSLARGDSPPPLVAVVPKPAAPKPRPPLRPNYELPPMRPPPMFLQPDSPNVRPAFRDPAALPTVARPPGEPRPAAPAAAPSAAALRAARRRWSPPSERLCFPSVPTGCGRPSHGRLRNFEAARGSADFSPIRAKIRTMKTPLRPLRRPRVRTALEWLKRIILGSALGKRGRVSQLRS